MTQRKTNRRTTIKCSIGSVNFEARGTKEEVSARFDDFLKKQIIGPMKAQMAMPNKTPKK